MKTSEMSRTDKALKVQSAMLQASNEIRSEGNDLAADQTRAVAVKDFDIEVFAKLYDFLCGPR